MHDEYLENLFFIKQYMSIFYVLFLYVINVDLIKIWFKFIFKNIIYKPVEKDIINSNPFASFKQCNLMFVFIVYNVEVSQLAFTCSKSTIETLEKGVEYVEN